MGLVAIQFYAGGWTVRDV